LRVLDRQAEAFAGRDRLIEMLLGLLGFGDRLAVVAGLERRDGRQAPEGPLLDVLLGLLSLRQTLTATISSSEGGPPEPVEAPAAPTAGLLR
jgi:hypothetical protein